MSCSNILVATIMRVFLSTAWRIYQTEENIRYAKRHMFAVTRAA